MSGSGAGLTVCLLPGLDGTGRLYRRLVAKLATDFDVRVLDYPNHVFDSYRSLAESIASRLSRDRPFVLVAESFAGPLSVLVAAKQPEGLRGLVIAASFLQSPVNRSDVLSRILHYLPPAIQPPLAMLETVLMGGWKDEAFREELASSLCSVAPQVLKSRLMAAMRVDVRQEFARIVVPVLYLKASRDRLLRKGIEQDFASAPNPPERVDIKAPHFVFQVVAVEAADVIRRFVADNSISND